MSDELKIEIKLKSFSSSDYFDVIFFTLVFGPVGVIFFFQGIRLLLTKSFSTYYLAGIIIGSLIFYGIFISIKTISKKIIFFSDTFEVEFFKKKINFEYSEIDWVKFIHPQKSSERIVIRLKKRKYGVKAIPISIKNKKEDLLVILNHTRNKNVPTGLNEIGEEYFKFFPTKAKYEFRKDKKIDIEKLW